jgi:hypothetical protein
VLVRLPDGTDATTPEGWERRDSPVQSFSGGVFAEKSAEGALDPLPPVAGMHRVANLLDDSAHIAGGEAELVCDLLGDESREPEEEDVALAGGEVEVAGRVAALAHGVAEEIAIGESVGGPPGGSGLRVRCGGKDVSAGGGGDSLGIRYGTWGRPSRGCAAEGD